MNEKFMSVNQVREALGISRNKVYELVNSKGFPTIRLGRRIVIPTKQFEAWVERQVDEKE